MIIIWDYRIIKHTDIRSIWNCLLTALSYPCERTTPTIVLKCWKIIVKSQIALIGNMKSILIYNLARLLFIIHEYIGFVRCRLVFTQYINPSGSQPDISLSGAGDNKEPVYANINSHQQQQQHPFHTPQVNLTPGNSQVVSNFYTGAVIQSFSFYTNPMVYTLVSGHPI